MIDRKKQIEEAAKVLHYHWGGVYPHEFETVTGSKQTSWESLEQWEHDELKIMAAAVLDSIRPAPIATAGDEGNEMKAFLEFAAIITVISTVGYWAAYHLAFRRGTGVWKWRTK